MANTTIDPGSGNTTRYYDSAALSLPDSDWCIGIWYRPNLSGSAHRFWDTGGGLPNGCYARTTHVAAGVADDGFTLRFIANDGVGSVAFDEEKVQSFPSGWAADTDFLLIVQRRSNNIELHICVKGGATYSNTPVAWALGALSSGGEFFIGSSDGPGNMLQNPYGEFFFLSGTSLSTANINTLKAGAAITAITATPTRYYKFRTSNDPEADLGTAGANADQNGSGWATDQEFFSESGGSGSIKPNAPRMTGGAREMSGGMS